MSAGRVAASVGAGALILMIPALINGYPLLFPDTGLLLVTGLMADYAGFHGTVLRNPFYGWWALFFHGDGRTLWPVAAAQCLVVAGALRAVLAAVLPGAGERAFLACATGLTALTGLPWHAAQILPDAFTGVVVLAAFLWANAQDGAGQTARLAGLLATAGLIVMHPTHVPVFVASFGAGLAVRVLQTASMDVLWQPLQGAILSLGLALGLLLLHGAAAVKSPTLAAWSDVFLMARLSEDGLARPWLLANCPVLGSNVFCRHAGLAQGSHVVFLWRSEGLVQRAIDDGLRLEEIARDAGAVAPAILRANALAFSAIAAPRVLRQFVSFSPLDTACPENCTYPQYVWRMFDRYFVAEREAMRTSLDMRRALPKQELGAVYLGALLAALTLYAVAAARGRSFGAPAAVGLLAAVVAALAVNAAVTGALSGVYDRYQSRVIWLLPFALVLASATLWTRAGLPDLVTALRWRRGR